MFLTGNPPYSYPMEETQVMTPDDADPDIDLWGTWDKLVPYQNVYDHKPNAWSTFGGYYCLFTPTDTGTAPDWLGPRHRRILGWVMMGGLAVGPRTTTDSDGGRAGAGATAAQRLRLVWREAHRQ